MSIESHPNRKETPTNVEEDEGDQNVMNQMLPLDCVDCDEAFDDKTPQEEQHVPILIERPFSLTAEESLLFSALLAAADYHYSKQTSASSSYSGSSTDPSNSSSKHHDSSQEVEGLSSSSAAFLNIRVAGGWVRDKLLRLSSDDIDITLDNVSGVQFAHMVRDYLEQYEDHDHHPHKYKIGVIAANPHQSKHLETATMKLFGYHVDFCHLRAEETYHPHSRIPVIREAFGTPYEDAMRRDFTINSLFYNIRSHTVEDYTRRGMHDLLTHPTIVTPLEAQETFHDDPLRVLRAIRFAVRFQYPIHETMRQAATSREIHDSLMRKVSRERVGTELEGMLTGKAAKPQMALTMIGELGLSDAVFRISTPGRNDDGGSRSGSEHGSCTSQPEMVPSTTTICGSIVYHCHDAYMVDNTVITNDTSPTRSSFSITGPSSQPPLAYQHQTTNEERKILRNHGWTESLHLLNLVDHLVIPYKEKWMRTYCTEGNSTTNVTLLDERIFLLSLYLSPFRDLTWQDPVKLKRNRVVTISMLKDGVKFPNRDVDAVECIMEHLDIFLKEIRRITAAMMTPTTSTAEDSKESSTFSRLQVGMLLRNVKHRWVTCLLVAGCIELRLTTSFQNTEQCEVVNATTRWNHIVQACENFYHYVQEQHLDCCWEARPLVNGKDIMQRLNLKGGGRIIGQLVEEQWKWMLQNPLGEKEDCVAFLQQKYLEIIHS